MAPAPGLLPAGIQVLYALETAQHDPRFVAIVEELDRAMYVWTPETGHLPVLRPGPYQVLFHNEMPAHLRKTGFSVRLPRSDTDRILGFHTDGSLYNFASLAFPQTWFRTGREPLFACLIRTLLDPTTPAAGFVLPVARLTQVRDWFDATRPDLSTWTFDQAVAAAEAWHHSLRGQRGHDVQYRGPVPDALVVLRWPSGWTWQRLMTKRDFAREGIAMGHCVGGDQERGPPDGNSDYYKLHRDGRGAFFSLRNAQNVPWVTVEVTLAYNGPDVPPWAFVGQVMGPDDGPVPGTEDADFEPFGTERARDYTVAALIASGLLLGPFSSRQGPHGELDIQAEQALDLSKKGSFDPNFEPQMKRMREIAAFDDLGRAIGADQGSGTWRHTHEELHQALDALTHIRGYIEDMARVSVADTVERIEVDGRTIPWFQVNLVWRDGRIDTGFIGVTTKPSGGFRWFARRVGEEAVQEAPSLVDAMVKLGPDDPTVALGTPVWFPDQTPLAQRRLGKAGFSATALAPLPTLKHALGSGE